MVEVREIRHFHLFSGIGGGAQGGRKAEASVNGLAGHFRCIGGIDSDPGAVEAFGKQSGARGTLLDLFTRDQYRRFHGQEPPTAWIEATVDDMRRAAGGESPHIVFLSPPCKGFSGLLSESRSKSSRYQALNELTLRGVDLALEAWPGEDRPAFFLLENVPRIQKRGRFLLDQIFALLRSAGYACVETTHDCGELGGLAQRRRRFLLVARDPRQVPVHLYEPPRQPLRAVGEVLGQLPLPGHPAAGPMHELGSYQWLTWLRLALVPAGGDWRDLQDLRVADGHLQDYQIVPGGRFNGKYGVYGWERLVGTVCGESNPTSGRYSIADPRYAGKGEYGQLGVRAFDEVSGAVTASGEPAGGRYSVADPRLPPARHRYNNNYKIVAWGSEAPTVATATRVGSGAPAVADPRAIAPTVTGGTCKTASCIADPRLGGTRHNNVYRLVPWTEPSQAVTAGSGPSSGGLAVADPRRSMTRGPGDAWFGAGTDGVIGWREPSGTVTSRSAPSNGRFAVADPRPMGGEPIDAVPAARDRGVWVIRALDGTWHRPFTTLELAALQGFVDPKRGFELPGDSHSRWRLWIGNAVPPPSATAVFSAIGHALLLAWSGETFALGSTPVWVRPFATAVSLDPGGVR